jgi:hypothetical protein
VVTSQGEVTTRRKLSTGAARGHPAIIHRNDPQPVDNMTPANAAAATDAAARTLDAHARLISPTGFGVRCACGQHFPDTTRWHRHTAELAADAAARVLT